MNIEVVGINELSRSFARVGKVPQKYVSAASRKALGIPLKKARQTAPVDEGNLKRGLKMQGERSRHRGKKVFRIVFNKSMNDIFQTRNADGKIVGYYPVSQEYGFFARDGSFVPGYAFTRKALENSSGQIERVITTEMKSRIDKELSMMSGLSISYLKRHHKDRHFWAGG
ncbi:MAG: hypothetical protein FWB96_11840 [Defluviitaleaceae bacterium]|nr:hypothetical protein [Defluviitaleaceae bacterium]MCL2263779.1 hypothetical protein [Defluviitaleaceae bacterium]